MKIYSPMIASVAVVASSLLLAGCENSNGPKQNAGTLLGAIGGALLGAELGGHGDGKVVGTAIGTFVGAGLGSSIGKSLDKADRMALQQAQQTAFEYNTSGTPSHWSNPDSGNSGYIVPQPAQQNSQGQYCREYTQEIIVGGERKDGYGTACRQPDGSWKIMSDQI